ncbi:hypothetical protein ACP4OV_006392 [Aristida adscensionis]
MFRSPRPHSSPAGEEGVGLFDGSAGGLPMSQFVAGRSVPEGDGDESGIGSIHGRVLPSTSFHGRQPADLLDTETFDLDEACND